MSKRRGLVALLALVAAGLAFSTWRSLERRSEPAAPAPARSAPGSGASPIPAPAPARTPGEAGAPEADPELPFGLGGVALAEVRAALPDNLYWQTSAPMDDPALLEQREREKAFRNDQYGKIPSGTGSDAEILDYYDQRMRASTDSVQFVDYSTTATWCARPTAG